MRVTSPGLKTIETSATRVWQKLVKKPDRFISAYTENVFGNFQAGLFPELAEWWRYTAARYRWVIE
jgi:hypothetical protein